MQWLGVIKLITCASRICNLLVKHMDRISELIGTYIYRPNHRGQILEYVNNSTVHKCRDTT